MRISSFLLLLFLWISCGQADQKEKPAPNSIDTVKEVEPKPALADSASKPSGPKFPLLTTENAPAFLKQYFNENPERKILIKTPKGNIKVRLFDDTPIHTANFLMLVKRGYFDSNKFTRVVEDFIVQGGLSDDQDDALERILIGSYELPPEIRPKHIHKRGALSQARHYKNNPRKLSNPYNFFLVQGRRFNTPEFMALERENDITIPPWKRQIYSTTGGAPHLDGEHTVFGEVYEGLEVVKALSEVPGDSRDWPTEPLPFSMEVIE